MKDPADRNDVAPYRQLIESTLRRMKAGKVKIRIAPQEGLYKRRPNSHFHAAPELFFQTGGATDFECPGGTFRLSEGDVCVMPRGVPHAETPIDLKSPYGIVVFMHRSTGFHIVKACCNETRNIKNTDSRMLPSLRGREAFRYLEDISQSDQVCKKHQLRYIHDLLEIYLITLADEFLLGHEDRSRSNLVQTAETLARQEIGNQNFSVGWLSNALGVSPDYLSRQFRHERKVTLKTWIVRERIEMAKAMLQDVRLNIAEIGWACGFSSSSYFIRVFERRNGVTPRNYRLAAAGLHHDLPASDEGKTLSAR